MFGYCCLVKHWGEGGKGVGVCVGRVLTACVLSVKFVAVMLFMCGVYSAQMCY